MPQASSIESLSQFVLITAELFASFFDWIYFFIPVESTQATPQTQALQMLWPWAAAAFSIFGFGVG